MSSRSSRRLLSRQAVGGSLTAANALIDGEPDPNKKVELVLNLCRKNAPREVVQEVLLHSINSHPLCIQPEVTGSRELLLELFNYAGYPKPRRKSETLYRGTAGIDADIARGGYFWANHRQQAVIYAMTRAWTRCLFNPTVIEAKVSDDDVFVATLLDGEFPIQNAVDDYQRHLEFIVLREQQDVVVDVISYEEAAINVPCGKEFIVNSFKAGVLDESQCAGLLERVDRWLASYREFEFGRTDA